MKVIAHVDNQAITHGIANRTIRGASMTVLRRCLLIAAEYDLELEGRWVSTKENALADALSRFDNIKITDLAPQLIHHRSFPLNLGFRTFTNRGSPG